MTETPEPATDDAVRRLLAESRYEEPLPPEVAARLDALLGELVESRTAQTQVHSLGRRRRQRRTLLLVAAAAVVVGIAVPTIDDSRSSQDSAGSSSVAEDSGSADSESGPAGSAQAPAQAPAPSSAQDQASVPPGVAAQPAPSSGGDGPLVLTSAGFEDDVRGIALSGAAANQAYSSDLSLTYDNCPNADYGPGELLAATYDGTPSVLALRPALGDTRVAELLACGTAELVRRTTVPAG